MHGVITQQSQHSILTSVKTSKSHNGHYTSHPIHQPNPAESSIR